MYHELAALLIAIVMFLVMNTLGVTWHGKRINELGNMVEERDKIIEVDKRIIDNLRAEIKTYQAIGNIIDSRCVDVMEPRPMEVGE